MSHINSLIHMKNWDHAPSPLSKGGNEHPDSQIPVLSAPLHFSSSSQLPTFDSFHESQVQGLHDVIIFP